MKCPSCGKDTLQPVYITMPAPLILDRKGPLQPRRCLAEMTCGSCQQSWYALPGETAATACIRICQEEPHP